jgi:hypothetical protein
VSRGEAVDGKTRRGWMVAAFVIAILAPLEIAWFSNALIEYLPNSAAIGGRVSRGLLMMQALPEVVPGNPWEKTHLRHALRELSHLENLPQRVPLIAAAALIATAMLSAGHLTLRGLKLRDMLEPLERNALSFGIGAILLAIATLTAGRLGLLSVWGVRIGLALPILAEVALRISGKEPLPRLVRPKLPAVAFLLIVGPFLLVMALGAMLPTTDFDCLEYHLQGPKEFYQNGRITFLPHNVYTSMPFQVEMLHLLGMYAFADWWHGGLVGQLLVMLHAPAAAALVFLVARRWGSARAAWFAAVVYLSTPWVYRLATFPYVEGPLCYYHAALIWSCGRAWKADRAAFWGIVGLLAGGAMACKYPGLVTAVVPFGVLAIARAARRSMDTESKRLLAAAPLFAFAAGVVIAVGPWLVKNAVDTGNPVYPLAYKVFGGSHWSIEQDAKWNKVHGPREVTVRALVQSAREVAGSSDWQSPLFTALAPLAFLRTGTRRFAALMFGYVVYLFAVWWLLTHRVDRFWLPLLPPLAILAGLGADWSRHLSWKGLLGLLMALGLASNATIISTGLAGPNEWTADLAEARLETRKAVNAPLLTIDRELPPDAKILLVGQASVFPMNHRIVYNTVFNMETIEALSKGRTAREFRQALVDLGITHVYIDWAEIDRYRGPENYGFTPLVTQRWLNGLVASGVLEPGRRVWPGMQEIYQVR